MPTPINSVELFPGIIELQIYFRDASGNFQTQFTTSSPQTTTAYISLVVVDKNSLKLLSGNQIGQLQSCFQPAQPQMPTWMARINAPDFFQGYPSSLRSGLEIYERGVILP